MTAKELLEFQLDDAGYQVQKGFDGLPDDVYEQKVSPEAMTPLDMLEHLTEAYMAVIAESKGEKYEWGSFKVEDRSPANLKSLWSDYRTRACAAVLDKGDAASLKSGHAYIVGHDYYHVGQICELRLKADPSFDAYSIYRH